MTRIRRVWFAVVVGFALMAGACARNAPQDTLKPEGPQGRTINNLFTPVFWIAVGVFVLVQGLLIYFLIRYRHREGALEPAQIHGNTRLEIGWTVLPALLLAGVAAFTIPTIFKLAQKPKNALNVTVTGHQFWWEYRYDDLDVVTANELHIPVGRDVRISEKGADVIHSFWVPKLNGKTDVIPGRVNHMRLRADHPGVYLGQCVEFCGLSHANMRLRAVAQTQDDFDAWVDSQRAGPTTPSLGTDAAQGLALFTQKGCAGCHTIQGVSQGQVGPNLTHVYSRTTFAGGIFDMSPGNLRKWLHDPPGEKPGSKMPNLHLSSDEISNLIAYLETLK